MSQQRALYQVRKITYKKLSITLISVLLTLFYSTKHYSAPQSCTPSALETLKYIKINNDGTYQGLSDYTKELIKTTHATLTARKAIFDQQFKQFESVFHAAHVNRLIKGNFFLYGPPGGAKSQFVRWIFSHETSSAFELQMHQMMTEQAFVGGQNYNAAREGIFEINTQGSLTDFTLALIDEIDKGNPTALAALLSLLQERKVLAGNKVIISPLETIFSTSNANIYDFMQQFIENGLRSTASALLNRFTSIAFIPNWLSRTDQAALDQNYIDKLDAFFAAGDNKKTDQQKQQQQITALTLDWEGLRGLARVLLRPNPEFMSASREFVEELRKQTINAVETSREQESTLYGSDETALPYQPTVEYTERLRQRVHDVVLMSLLLDILSSPLVENITQLESTLQHIPYHRLPVSPLSLWRAYLTLTTVTFGTVALRFPTHSSPQKEIDLDFGTFFKASDTSSTQKMSYKPNDKREAHNINFIIEEQQRFKKIFLGLLSQHKKILEEASAFNSLFSCVADGAHYTDLETIQDLERLLVVYAHVKRN